MGASLPEAKVEPGRLLSDRHAPHSILLRVCKAARRRHPPGQLPGFRWLYRRGPTRSHPEHGSQALQSRWYCTLCVWESRSLPEFFSKTPRRSLRAAGRRLSSRKLTATRSTRRRGERGGLRLEKTYLRDLRVSAFAFQPAVARFAALIAGRVR